MGTHIIWRNPSPPSKKLFKVRRVAGNRVVALYQVASPSYQRSFELVSATNVAAWRKAQTAAVSPRAELVSARW